MKVKPNSKSNSMGPTIVFKDGFLRILLEKNMYEIDLSTEEVRAFVKEKTVAS